MYADRRLWGWGSVPLLLSTLLLIFKIICMHHMCAGVWCVCVCVTLHVWRSGDNVVVLLPLHGLWGSNSGGQACTASSFTHWTICWPSTLYFETRAQWICSFPFWPDWLASKPSSSSCLQLPRVVPWVTDTVLPLCQFHMWALGVQSWVFRLWQQALRQFSHLSSTIFKLKYSLLM